MTDALLLDTHVALWLDSGDDRLRASTRSLLDGFWGNGQTIFLGAVTLWEISLLGDTGRIDLDVLVTAWIARFRDRPGIEGVQLRHEAAARSYDLHRPEHPDLADRLLIATAIACPLGTYDERIGHVADKHGRQ